MRETTFIYALKDPRTNEIRYIGKANDPKERYSNHINKCRDKNTHKRNWINNLRQEKLKPILEILEEVPIDKWKEYEKMYIKKYIVEGCILMNYTEGGDGCTFGNKTSYKKGEGGRKIVMLDKNGVYIRTFNMIIDAEKELNSKSIFSSISKSRKTSKGYSFLYEEEYLNMTDQDIKKHVEWLKPKKLISNKTSYKEREVIQYDLKMIFIKNWISLAEAEKALNISKSSICQCAKGKNKTGGGFIWKYKNNENN